MKTKWWRTPSTANEQVHDFIDSGTWGLDQGVRGGTVTGLTLEKSPERIYLQVSIPSGGLRIRAWVVGIPSATSFDFSLSGIVDGAGYFLNYWIEPTIPEQV